MNGPYVVFNESPIFESGKEDITSLRCTDKFNSFKDSSLQNAQVCELSVGTEV